MKIVIKNKHFKDKIVFSDFELELPKGTVSVLKAPSGRGKTTLLKIILSLDKDYEGFILDPPRFPIAVFQEDRLIPSLSVKANLRAVSSNFVMMEEILGKVGLSGELDSKIDTLSGGMKRRVAIVRALLIDYDWLLLDEPFKGLDDSTKKDVAEVLLSYSKGKSIIVITHDDEDAILMKGTLYNI